MRIFLLPGRKGGDEWLLKDNGKVTLICLFSSWCAYSVASVGLVESFAKLAGDKVNITIIWEDKGKHQWLNHQHIAKDNMLWQSLWDEYGFAGTYFKRKIWPTFLVVNEEGVLTQVFTEYSEKSVAKLKSLLQR